MAEVARWRVVASAGGGVLAGAIVLAAYVSLSGDPPPPDPATSPGPEPAASASPAADGPGGEGPASEGPSRAESSASAAASAAASTPVPAMLEATAITALTQEACEVELRRRQVPFELVLGEQIGDVRQPMRIVGPLAGVELVPTGLASSKRPHPYDVADCRLLLALEQMARVAREQGVVAVEFFGMYRPSRSAGAKSAGRHAEGLAIDIGAIQVKGAEPLVVLSAFDPHLGKRPCPPKTDAPDDYGGQVLRTFACAMHDGRLFNVVLTPNEGPSHKDHFHFDLTEGASWYHLE